jgi:replicative DNA helicase
MRSEQHHTTGVSTGFKNLDHYILGLQKSDLVIIAARPSMGKTSFALTVALNAAKAGSAVLFVSLEMSEPQLTARLLCAHARFNSNRLREAYLSKSEFDLLATAREELRNVPLFIDDSPRVTVLEMRAKARRLRQKGMLDAVMVDYLQLIDPSDKRLPREQQISEISRSLKAMAKELDVPVVALSQLSRAPEGRPGNDKRPLLSDLRESGAIEQDADVVMFLYRPAYYKRKKGDKDGEEVKPEEENLLEVIVSKQRNGPTGTAKLTFLMDTMTILDRMEDPYGG